VAEWHTSETNQQQVVEAITAGVPLAQTGGVVQ
jgi:hypothetical protein